MNGHGKLMSVARVVAWCDPGVRYRGVRPRCAARAENLLMAQVCRPWRVRGTLQSLYRCAVARLGEASESGHLGGPPNKQNKHHQFYHLDSVCNHPAKHKFEASSTGLHTVVNECMHRHRRFILTSPSPNWVGQFLFCSRIFRPHGYEQV